MSRFITALFTVALLFASAPVQAQEETASSLPPMPMASGGEASGPLNCFDYYTFGSVQSDLQPTMTQTVPGVSLTFSGEVVNTNPYPLLDGTLYVKIFKRDDDTFVAGDGNEVVDQFVVKDDITLKANSSLSLSYDWKVPLNAEGGEYYAAYFFTTADRYNLMGLSFTDDVVGNQAPFTITSDNTVAKLSKVDTRLNEKNHNFAAFPLQFAAGDTVTVTTTITNPGSQPKTLPLQWNQYAWDAMLDANLRYTHTEVVTLAPNETKTVSYEVKPQRESVVYITAVTQDNEAKSILNIRYVRDGIEETRINFPGLTSFPLEKDKDTTLFACAHSTNLPIVPGNTLTLTLTDKDGETIHQYQHIGDISGAMAGFGEVFRPAKNINYAVLTATLERNGVTVEEVKQVYDCSVIDQATCLPESEEDMPSFLDFFTKNILTMVIGLVVFLLIGIVGFIIYQKRKHYVNGGPTITTPMAVLFFLFILPSLFLLPQGAEAKSVTWTGNNPKLYYYGNYAPVYSSDTVPLNTTRTPADGRIAGSNGCWVYPALDAGSFVNINYKANLYNADTNALISDGASVPAGTRIRIVRDVSTLNSDITWGGTGRTFDTPYGRWINNAGPTSVACSANDYAGNAGESGFSYDVYIPFSVNPPSVSTVNPSSNLTHEGGDIYRITAAGPVSLGMNFSATHGRFYYRYNVTSGDPTIYEHGCYANNVPMSSSGSDTYYASMPCDTSLYDNPYTLNIPAQTITFNITGTGTPPPTNNPPSTTITGPTSGTVNTPYTFGIRGVDPEGDTVRVGVDWNRDGTPDIGSPYGNFSPSGTTENFSQTWTTPGTYTFQANSQDSVSMGVSPWVTHTITIAAAPVTTADLTINGSNGPINVPANTSVNLNWTSANAASCSKWGGTWGSGQAIPLTGSDSTVVTTTTTYMVNCGGVTDSVTVNVVNQGPGAPTINYVSGTREAGQTLTFAIRGTDPDNDNVFYEIDWDNNGTVDATTMTVPSGTTQNGNRSWATIGTVTFQARTVDTAGARSGWTSHSETLAAPPPPTTTFEVRVNSGSWGAGNPPPVDTNDTVTLRWGSTGATSCTGTNFNTGGATNNSGTNVTTPAPGGSTTFTLNCTGPGGSDSKSITVSVGLPNFNRPIATHNLSTTFNPTTGEYDWVTISFQTTNDGQSGTAATAPYSVQFDSRTPVTGTIPLLTRGSASPNFTHTINTIPFGNHTATIVVDTNNSVAESNEGDNTYVYNFGGMIPPPNPGLNITADKIQLRNGETTVIRWSTTATYPTLECTVQGPGMSVNPAPLTGNQTTQPITAKSEYTFSCTETITGTTWTDSVLVETQGVIEEI